MINENDTFSRVTAELKSKGILKREFFFRRLAILWGVDRQLRRGRYDFAGETSVYRILRKLKAHDIVIVRVTIPEGMTAAKIASVMALKFDLDADAFLRRVFDTTYAQGQFGYPSLEGYLFPETYFIPYGLTIDEIMQTLVDQFKKQTDSLLSNLPETVLPVNELITLASIIEAEAMVDEEKPVISSVYHNRLKKKMRLQADPTVIYALGGLDRPLYYRDLKYDSPYNTYKYRGLPPGPINSPGLKAIEAAIFPNTTDYLYFVADGNGRHVFSRTLNEHNRAKNRIKREKKGKD
jgi:UPF0755 protein